MTLDGRPVRNIWSQWYGWHSVLPIDASVFSLETMYRWESPVGF